MKRMLIGAAAAFAAFAVYAGPALAGTPFAGGSGTFVNGTTQYSFDFTAFGSGDPTGGGATGTIHYHQGSDVSLTADVRCLAVSGHDAIAVGRIVESTLPAGRAGSVGNDALFYVIDNQSGGADEIAPFFGGASSLEDNCSRWITAEAGYQLLTSGDITVSDGSSVPAMLTLAASNAVIGAGQQECATATNGVPGIDVTFDVTGADSAQGDATTGADGSAQYCYTPTHAGTDHITASDGYRTVSADVNVVAGAPASMTLTPASSTVTADAQQCETATVVDAYGNPTPGTSVGFTVSGSDSATVSETTDANGSATSCYTAGALPGIDTVTADAGANVTATATVTVVAPAATPGCTVRAAGTTGSASFQVGQDVRYTPHGRDHGPSVVSTSVSSVTCSGGSAELFGTAGGVEFRVDLTATTFRIRLADGYDSGVLQITGGNVQIRS